jgi:peptide/nickel transport system ATP-binding protein
MNSDILLAVSDLRVTFGGDEVVHGAGFEIRAGETVAIVGESGSGKSTIAHALIGLLPGTGRVTGGTMVFAGSDLAAFGPRDFEKVRGTAIGFVPQDPMNSLNPVHSIGFQVGEAVRVSTGVRGRRSVRERSARVLRDAGLPDAGERLRQFPHQFSGGMRQRVMIGIALAGTPRLLIADEPTSALDVTVQKTILDDLAVRTRERGVAVLLITHDLAMAADRADRIIVMYRGEIVEQGTSAEVLQEPKHPYTRRLLAAAPGAAARAVKPAEVTEPEAPIIEISDVTKKYTIRGNGAGRRTVVALEGVSATIERGSTTAIVGESGSGKSTLARIVLGLESPTSGTVSVAGHRLESLSPRNLLAVRRMMQPVFQDPYGSLDPRRTIADSIGEPLSVHRVGDRSSRRRKVLELLDDVALPSTVANRYPNELSGGQRQRVAIARALALNPDIVVLDEAVSALDVLVQAQILDLLATLQRDLGLTYLLISHDLGVVKDVARTVLVMRGGRIVERGTIEEVFANPSEPYTAELIAAIPGGASPR